MAVFCFISASTKATGLTTPGLLEALTVAWACKAFKLALFIANSVSLLVAPMVAVRSPATLLVPNTKNNTSISTNRSSNAPTAPKISPTRRLSGVSATADGSVVLKEPLTLW